MRIKTIAHALAAIGEPLGDKDLLLAILNGLDHDYETVLSPVWVQATLATRTGKFLYSGNFRCLPIAKAVGLSSAQNGIGQFKESYEINC